LLFVIVNSAASFALDAQHCNNTTGSRGKELHRAGHRKSLLSPIPPFHFQSIALVMVFLQGVQAPGLGSQPPYRHSISCHLRFATMTDGLRLGSSLHDFSMGRPRGQNLVYPICATLFLSPLINVIGYCLLYISRQTCCFSPSCVDLRCPCIRAHGSETGLRASYFKAVSDAQCSTPTTLAFARIKLTCHYSTHPLLPPCRA
jgi:hypothetical protein